MIAFCNGRLRIADATKNESVCSCIFERVTVFSRSVFKVESLIDPLDETMWVDQRLLLKNVGFPVFSKQRKKKENAITFVGGRLW